VTVRLDALPTGVTASALTITGDTGIFLLSASPGAPLTQNVAVNVTGTNANGSATSAATLMLSVASPDGGFSLGVAPRTLRLSRGSTGSALVTVIRRNFSGLVTVTVSGLPDAGVTADSLTVPANRGNLVFRAAPNATPGTSPLTLLGTSGSTSAETPLSLVVLDPGGVDETFGASGPTPGWVVTHLDSSDGGTTVSALAVAVQPDGKILVAGNRTRRAGIGGDGCGPTHLQNCIALTLTRYNSDGTLDPTFGAPDAGVLSPPPPGVAILPEGSNLPPITWPTPQAIAVTDGGILVAAGGPTNNPDTLLQFTLDGILDPSFNPDGGNPGHARRTINAKALIATTDGGILVGGVAYPPPSPIALALARYRSDGTLDTTFGDGGILFNQFVGAPTINGACGAAFSEGKARVATIINQRVGVMSFDISGNGSIDESFNGNGQAVVSLGGNNASPCAVLDLAGNTVVIAGATGPTDIVLGSFQPDGGLDPGFGDGGIARAHLPPEAGSPIAAAAATFAGQIMVVGSVSAIRNQLLIARYNSDGSPDLAFGPAGTGYIINVPDLLGAQFNAVVVQADGKILGAGNTPAAAGQQMVIRYLGSGPGG
jgi:uncharacterized delta-60 repeat protein